MFRQICVSISLCLLHRSSQVAVTKDYEMYTTHHLMTSKLEVLASCHKIRRWIKTHEDYLFIMHSPFWQ